MATLPVSRRSSFVGRHENGGVCGVLFGSDVIEGIAADNFLRLWDAVEVD